MGLPAVLLVIQLAGAAATAAGHHGPARHLGAADWVLLVVGPAALVFRRRWPVGVLWVAFAATLTPSGAWPANLSLIVAFFLAAIVGHAARSTATVRLGYGPGGLDIEVSDDGRSPAANGSSSRPGTGNGIAGMRERAAALGGRLEAGPDPGGGFVVTTHLSLGGPS